MTNELKLLKMIFDNLDDPTYIIDSNGKTLLANSATLRMYQCSKELFSQYYSDTYDMLRRGVYTTTVFEKVIAKKEAVSAWNEVINTNQEHNLYYVLQKPIFDAEGNIKYVIGTNTSKERIQERYHILNEKDVDLGYVQLITGETNSPLIYRSSAMETIIQFLRRIINTSANVLIFGDTGVGKDVVANYIHENSLRSKKDMISLNCAAISPSLFETEMFGYVSGAFTGANTSGKPGLIESAQNSTLFLDEVDSIPFELQGKLLRALETKTIRRVGNNKLIPVDFRLIAATNKNLEALVQEGKFREDLYYRLNVLSITIPPLRERKEDIRILADFFLKHFTKLYGLEKRFSEHIYEQLENYDWPGNVRELKNVIERTVLTSEFTTVELSSIHIPKKDQQESTFGKNVSTVDFREQNADDITPLSDRIEEYEKTIIQQALNCCGSATKAAQYLDISLSTLSRKMSKYGIDKE